MQKKVVLYLAGGAMSGIFGAGVLSSFQEMDLYDRIEAMYGASGGAINGAYFLARQSEFGASIYYEDLIQNFILPFNVPKGVYQAFWNKYVHTTIPLLAEKEIAFVVNIDYIFSIMEHKKPLDVKMLKKQPIKFYAKLLNIASWQAEYVDVKEDPLKVLRATVSIAPYYYRPQKIEGKSFIDIGIKEPLGIGYLLRKYPNHKIIVVFNSPYERKLRFYAKNALEGLISRVLFDIPLHKTFLKRESSVRTDLELAKKNTNVLLIHPPDDSPTQPWTTNRERLLRTFELGKREARKVEGFIAP